MALDKDIEQLIANYQGQHFPPYTSFTPQALRQWFDAQFAKKTKPAPIKIAKMIEHTLHGPAGELTCRIYYPEGDGPFPALMYFHGGGFVIRDNMDIYDQTCRMLCHDLPCAVIAVQFRLAPEHPFPAAPEDCYAATSWVAQHTAELNIDAEHLGVLGESCGGNLAAVVAMMARDRHGPKIKCQIIITAMLDHNFTTASYQQNGNGDYILTTPVMQWFWNNYIHDASDIKNPYCIPCAATNLNNLPPAYVTTVEYDPLRDDGKRYAEQLKAANVPTTYRCFAGLIHGVLEHGSVSPTAKKACAEVMAQIRQLLYNGASG